MKETSKKGRGKEERQIGRTAERRDGRTERRKEVVVVMVVAVVVMVVAGEGGALITRA
jgi:hypothetical protein